MERLKNLNGSQKGILILMAVMAILFAVIYPRTLARVGYRYRDSILVPSREAGNTIYEGKIEGKPARFIVDEDQSVVFHYGDKTYGAYIMNEDPAAIPEKEQLADQMKGIEIRNGDAILFRGGVLDAGDSYWLYNEDGSLDNFGISIVTGDGLERDLNGNVIDRMEPSASTIYELLNEPELTHKGDALGWFGAVFICILNALSMLFAEELFLWKLAFRIRNAEIAEPSDLEIAGRYMAWTVMTVMALVIFIVGLQ